MWGTTSYLLLSSKFESSCFKEVPGASAVVGILAGSHSEDQEPIDLEVSLVWKIKQKSTKVGKNLFEKSYL